MWAKNKQNQGFTIVELLIVIVVIGILAAITVVAYSGIQNRARQAAISSELSSNSTKMMLSTVSLGRPPSTLEVLSGTDTKISITSGNYRILTYCSSDKEFVMAAESKSGTKSYTKTGSTVIQDNSMNIYSPCSWLGLQNSDGTAASTTYLGMPATACATENGVCIFSGTATIVYGSAVAGRFDAKPDLTSPVDCTNVFFGDPASGISKSCYVMNN